jgi:DNA polymerase-3 subunit gamma/tau
MNTLALARKYRPQNFAELAGQQHVLQTLVHALENNRHHHAYLFTGTHGVGKTSLARILAKCFNCEQKVTSQPCDTCSNCQQINQGRHLDVIEIDAASRTKVEDTRELLDNIQYAPNEARFKIYIVDEVHMLSGHSFNALLKTLEEPPQHVIFILATTDPQKLPPTVLSRCLQFHLKNISPEQIVAQLKTILQHESITTFEENALTLIAKAAKGSLRDALSLLDQSINYTQQKLTELDIANMLGYVSETHIQTLLFAIQSKNTKVLLDTVNTLNDNGADFFMVLDEFLSTLQKMALDYFMNHSQNNLSAEEIQLYYQIALIGKRDLPLAPEPKSGFIMILLRLMAFTCDEINQKKTYQTKSGIQEIKKEAESAIKSTISAVLTEAGTAPTEWSEIVTQLPLSGMTKLLAENAVLKHPQQNQCELIVHHHYAALLNTQTKDNLTHALSTYFNKNYRPIENIIISVGAPESETPQEEKTRTQEEKTSQAKSTVLSDKNIQSFMNTFSATLESVSPINSTTTEE